MAPTSNGHISLDSKILNDVNVSNLRLVLVKRSIDLGNEDLVIHGYSNVLGPKVTSNTVLAATGFQLYGQSCPYVGHQGCFYKVLPSDTQIDLDLMAKEITEVVPKIQDAERALNECGWSIFHEYIPETEEGHRGVEKKVLKKVETSIFTFIMTYITNQYGNDMFVTHFIPKQGPDYPPEIIAVMDFLEMHQFNGCPESEYRKCFYNTYENTVKHGGFNRSADIAHKRFDKLEQEFNKAYGLLIDADSCLRRVGLNILQYKEVGSSGIKTDGAVGVASQETAKSSDAELFEWDAFICHASEDKELFVRELASKLTEQGLSIWYDEFTLKVGDSLRRSIDKGLAKSRYGIVVLSTSFFNKEWPQIELDGLAVRERHGKKVILPVWLGIDENYIEQFSPTLADRVAAKSKEGIGKVIIDLLSVIRTS
jgi:hypothetical protein